MTVNMQQYTLVVGGNRGIGLEVVRKLVDVGKPVILTSRDPASGAAVLKQLAASKENADIQHLAVDTSKTASIEALAEAVKDKFNGKIDLVINNAGINLGDAWDQDTLATTLATNVDGPVDTTYKLLPYLAPGALVIMVSSELGTYKFSDSTPDYVQPVKTATTLDQLKAAGVFHAEKPGPAGETGFPLSSAAAYNVSKLLLNKAVQLMNEDEKLKSKGVSVVSVCPGWCRTDMGSADAPRSAEEGAASVLWPAFNWSPDLAGGFSRDGAKLAW
eukprot:jgi/Chrzof1/3729/Cz13g06240.t1